MGTLAVRNVPDPLIHEIERLALRQHKTMDEEVVSLLEGAIRGNGQRQGQGEILERLRRFREKHGRLPGPDSVALIREDRQR
jgi:plasmid stability protein